MRILGVSCLSLALLVACKSKSEAPPAKTPPKEVAKTGYHATIRWTSYGIPHIEAKDLRSLAFGQGYAFATQNVCVLADQIVKVRSERGGGVSRSAAA